MGLKLHEMLARLRELLNRETEAISGDEVHWERGDTLGESLGATSPERDALRRIADIAPSRAGMRFRRESKIYVAQGIAREALRR